MRLFKRRDAKGQGATAVVDRPKVDRPDAVNDEFTGSTEELLAEIDRLNEANRAERDRNTERRLLHLRHLAGIRFLVDKPDRPELPTPAYDRLPETDGLPEFTPDDLDPELMRAAILRDGCILVRGLVDRDEALHFADQIDCSFAVRESILEGDGGEPGYYEEFAAQSPFEIDPLARTWTRTGGGVLAPDAPLLNWEMIEMFKRAGLPDIVGGYLGERPLISLQKTTLRKAEPHVAGAWHQDGAFMGDVRALNLWLSLSRCGDESPGLDIVPRRLNELQTTTTDEALLSYQVSQAKAEEAAGDKPVIRPIFEPGDALFFDELFLHQTGSDPEMPKPRYAIESWFFGASAFPEEYGPEVV